MDGCFTSVVNRNTVLIDVVDQAWQEDCLSDDDLPLALVGEAEEEPNEPPRVQRDEDVERWHDLGLGQFLNGEEPQASSEGQ